jgi:endonuclease-3
MPGESQRARRDRAARIVRHLARAYPDAKIALRQRNAFQLLIATILSAQCTDERVNEVTPVLFRRYPKPADLADAEPSELETIIRSTGFYRQKAKSLLGASRDICERFGGRVPRTMEELVSLPGVARKTANLVLGEAFGVPGLAVDTHMKRVNQRLELTDSDDPNAVERDLMALIPQQEWTAYTRRVIHHGRRCCSARRPQCESCPLGADCPWPSR